MNEFMKNPFELQQFILKNAYLGTYKFVTNFFSLGYDNVFGSVFRFFNFKKIRVGPGYIAFFKEGFSIFKGIPGFLVSHRCNLYDIFVLPFAGKVLS